MIRQSRSRLERSRRASLAAAAAVVAAAALVAACGSTSPTGTPVPAPTQPTVTTAPATQIPLPSLGPGFSITLPSEDKALEDQLPAEVGGATITKASMAGDTLVGSGQTQMSQVLTKLGKTPADISAAFGNGGGVSLAAYRLKGVDATTLLAAFATMLTGEDAPTITDASVGGKQVKQVVTAGLTVYVYARGDVLFTANKTPTGTDAAVAEAISKLP